MTTWGQLSDTVLEGNTSDQIIPVVYEKGRWWFDDGTGLVMVDTNEEDTILASIGEGDTLGDGIEGLWIYSLRRSGTHIDENGIYTGILRAEQVISGLLQGVDVKSVSEDGLGTVTLKDGEISTMQNGVPVMKVNRQGLSLYHGNTWEISGTLRDSYKSASGLRGINLMGEMDYMSIGFKDAGSTLATPWIDMNKLTKETYVYGGAVEGSDLGALRLYSTRDGGTAKGKVPSLKINNFSEKDEDGTVQRWSSIICQTGRDNSSPEADGRRFGFEVWQYKGDGKGGNRQMFRLDADAGFTYMSVYTDRTYLSDQTFVGSNGGSKRVMGFDYDTTKFTVPAGTPCLWFGETTVELAKTDPYAYRPFTISFAKDIHQVYAQPSGSSSVYFSAAIYSITSTGFSVYLQRLNTDATAKTITVQLMMLYTPK